MNIKPHGERILVEPIAGPDKVGSIIIPEGAKEKPQECIILDVGQGRLLMNSLGKFVEEPIRIKVGARVLVAKYGGSEIKLDGKELKLITEADVLAIITS